MKSSEQTELTRRMGTDSHGEQDGSWWRQEVKYRRTEKKGQRTDGRGQQSDDCWRDGL